jgi:serine/threonine protein kinase
MSTLENFGNYKLGGYHPIEIGDELHNGCYRILHRLGYGSYSTVWLALNQRFDMESEPRSRYVAIKVLIANASDAKYDGSIMRYLRLHKPSRASENNEMMAARLSFRCWMSSRSMDRMDCTAVSLRRFSDPASWPYSSEGNQVQTL